MASGQLPEGLPGLSFFSDGRIDERERGLCLLCMFAQCIHHGGRRTAVRLEEVNGVDQAGGRSIQRENTRGLAAAEQVQVHEPQQCEEWLLPGQLAHVEMQDEALGVALRVVSEVHQHIVDDGVAQVGKQVVVGVAELGGDGDEQGAEFVFVHAELPGCDSAPTWREEAPPKPSSWWSDKCCSEPICLAQQITKPMSEHGPNHDGYPWLAEDVFDQTEFFR